jgi:hypothetical protein
MARSAKAAATVSDFTATLTAEQAAVVDVVRQLVMAASSGVTEQFKWNAPSFCLNGDDRVTLGIERDGSVRMVLHRGAKPKDATNFHFDDSLGLATWPAVDRGIVRFRDAREVESRRGDISSLLSRWFVASR